MQPTSSSSVHTIGGDMRPQATARQQTRAAAACVFLETPPLTVENVPLLLLLERRSPFSAAYSQLRALASILRSRLQHEHAIMSSVHCTSCYPDAANFASQQAAMSPMLSCVVVKLEQASTKCDRAEVSKLG